jgi:hypothetical protein
VTLGDTTIGWLNYSPLRAKKTFNSKHSLKHIH